MAKHEIGLEIQLKDKASKPLDAIDKKADKLSKKPVEIEVGADVKGASRDIDGLLSKVDKLAGTDAADLLLSTNASQIANEIAALDPRPRSARCQRPTGRRHGRQHHRPVGPTWTGSPPRRGSWIDSRVSVEIERRRQGQSGDLDQRREARPKALDDKKVDIEVTREGARRTQGIRSTRCSGSLGVLGGLVAPEGSVPVRSPAWRRERSPCRRTWPTPHSRPRSSLACPGSRSRTPPGSLPCGRRPAPTSVT